ncbi:unnamed protein product, partial [Polarella glacialis]
RQRTVFMNARNAGKPCEGGESVELADCPQAPCTAQVEVCEWSPWAPWTDCKRGGAPVACGGGERKRTRASVLKLESLPNGATSDVSSDGSMVSMAIGSSSARRLGLTSGDCKELQDEVQACAEVTCTNRMPEDCLWSAWSQWSACPCSGINERHRVIASVAEVTKSRPGLAFLTAT